jgi:tetratricopeptide (TPR) repeat protein
MAWQAAGKFHASSTEGPRRSGGRRTGRIWVGLSAILAAFFVALPAFAQTGGLSGKVTLQDGTPCVKCTVQIDRLEIKGNYHVNTNKKGEYVYVGLPIGMYKITFLDPDGRTLFFFNNKHIGMGDPTDASLDMAKEAANAKKEQQANPEAQKVQEQAAKDQKQFTGLKQFFDQGNALFDQGQYAQAAAAFEQAVPLAKDKNLQAVLTREAESYHKARMNDKAVETYQKAIAANPTDAGLHNNLGSVYADMGKIPEAQQEFEKSAQIDPANASRAYFNMGVVMYNKGKMDEASAALKKSTELDPKYADAYFLEAQALVGKATLTPEGKIVPAPGTVDALQTYLKLDPNGKYAQAAQQMLQQMSGEIQTQYKKKKKG